jgi:hypothetical protein
MKCKGYDYDNYRYTQNIELQYLSVLYISDHFVQFQDAVEQEALGRIYRLLSFDTTPTA